MRGHFSSRMVGIVFALGALSFSCSTDSDSDTAATASGNMTIKGAIGANSNSASLADSGIDPAMFEVMVHRVGFSTNADCSSPTIISAAGTYQDFMADPTLGQGNLDDGTYNCIIIEMGSVIRFGSSENSDSTENGEAICKEYDSTATVGTPSTTTGAATGDSSANILTQNVCQSGGISISMDAIAAGNSFATVLQSFNDGEDTFGSYVTECTGSGNETVTLYLSTGATDAPDSCYSSNEYLFSAPPNSVDSCGGSKLLNALVVSGTATGSFVAGAQGVIAVSSNNGQGDGDNNGGSSSLQGSSSPSCEMDEPSWSFTEAS